MTTSTTPTPTPLDSRDGREARPQRGIPMRFVVILTLVVTGFAAAVAIWMYWLAGLIA